MDTALHGTSGLLIGYGVVALGIFIGLRLARAEPERLVRFPLYAIPALIVIAMIWGGLVSWLTFLPSLGQNLLGMAFFLVAGGLAGRFPTRSPVEPGDETKHFKMIGTSGTGKSTAIRELLSGALAQGDRAAPRHLPVDFSFASWLVLHKWSINVLASGCVLASRSHAK